MAEKRSHNKLQPMGGRTDGLIEFADLADDGSSIPTTRLIDVAMPAPSLSTRGLNETGLEEQRWRTAATGQAGFPLPPPPHRPASNDAAAAGARAAAAAAEISEAYGAREVDDQLIKDTSLEGVAKRLDACYADVDSLRKKLEGIGLKLEDSESVHRGQLDCISERIFEAERNLRQAEERQDEAIEKASATFQKQSSNLMHVINQVNSNFEHLSSQIAQQGVSMNAFEQNIAQIQASMAQSTSESRNATLAVESMGHDWTALEHSIQQQHQGVEHELQQQQQHLSELQISMQAVRDALVRMTPHTQFAEVESKQRSFQEQMEAFRGLLYEVQAEQRSFSEQLAATQEQAARLAASSIGAASGCGACGGVAAAGGGAGAAGLVGPGNVVRRAASGTPIAAAGMSVGSLRLLSEDGDSSSENARPHRITSATTLDGELLLETGHSEATSPSAVQQLHRALHAQRHVPHQHQPQPLQTQQQQAHLEQRRWLGSLELADDDALDALRSTAMTPVGLSGTKVVNTAAVAGATSSRHTSLTARALQQDNPTSPRLGLEPPFLPPCRLGEDALDGSSFGELFQDYVPGALWESQEDRTAAMHPSANPELLHHRTRGSSWQTRSAAPGGGGGLAAGATMGHGVPDASAVPTPVMTAACGGFTEL